MSEVDDILRNAKLIRQRLRYPPNAVPDTGVDLTRKSTAYKGSEPVPEDTPPKKSLDQISIERQIEEHPEIKIPINLDQIIAAVSRHFRIPQKGIRGPIRRRKYVTARRYTIVLSMRMLPHISFSAMARRLERDHTTILYARNAMLREMDKDPRINHELSRIEQSIIANHNPRSNLPAVRKRNMEEREERFEKSNLPQQEIHSVDSGIQWIVDAAESYAKGQINRG